MSEDKVGYAGVSNDNCTGCGSILDSDGNCHNRVCNLATEPFYEVKGKPRLLTDNCNRCGWPLAESGACLNMECSLLGVRVPSSNIHGWICPKCNAAVSPTVTRCPCFAAMLSTSGGTYNENT